jgi:hypothetical protein
MNVQVTNEDNECIEEVVENTFFGEESTFDLFQSDVCAVHQNGNY